MNIMSEKTMYGSRTLVIQRPLGSIMTAGAKETLQVLIARD